MTVLLLGESGTGKHLVARAIHVRSGRHDNPFLPVNCTAIPEHLFESELIGHERGAITDARDRKKGLVELANGGTLFLDEIGDVSPAGQARLLRFLEEGSYRELRNVLERALILEVTDEVRPEHLPDGLARVPRARMAGSTAGVG